MASAELFKVTCVTCQASLSVRNAALIGQIVGCPKCNSMVHIELPAASASAAPAVAATPPLITQPYFEDPVEEVAEQLTAEVAQPAPVTHVASVLEAGTASSTKFLIWSVASFVIGAALTGTFLVLRAGDANEHAAVASPTITTPAEETESAPPVTETGTESTEEPADQKKSPGIIATNENLVDENPVDDNPFAIEPIPAEPSLLGPIEEPAAEPVTEKSVAEAPVTPTVEPPAEKPTTEPAPRLVIGAADEPRLARKFDPLALDPEQLDLSTVTEAGADAAEPEANEPAPDGTEPSAGSPLARVVKLNQEAGGVSGSRSAETQLKRVLPALTVKEMPLLNFLTLVSQLAGVPVSVTPEQLLMAGITPGRTVSLDVKATSLADALAKVLTPLRLEATTLGPQIVIVRQDAAKVRGIDYPIDDLLGSQTTSAQFADWIEKLIACESWQTAGGEGQITASEKSLRIEQTQSVQYQVLFFLERIRLAKDMPLRSRYPERLLSAKPYRVGIADRLTAPATFTFSHETPLAEVFHYWQGEAGLPIFVDWPSLATVKLWPDSHITCAITNEPWQDALDTVLAPLGLGWRPAPGGAIQITSRARIETEPQLEIYPAGTWQGDSAGATVIHDPVNNLTYVRASAANNRQ